jgi:hypothetical protein
VLNGNDYGNNSASYLNLQSQVWALINADALGLNTTQSLALWHTIEEQLWWDSPIGPRLIAGDGGLVWPAISQLLPWALTRLSRSSSELSCSAWQVLASHSYANHGCAFPDSWLGLWSGPDGTALFNSHLFCASFSSLGFTHLFRTLCVGEISSTNSSAANPGGTWCSAVTPMTDFPVSNANPDAGWVNALRWSVGIEPAKQGDGLQIDVRRVQPGVVFDAPLIKLSVNEQSVTGQYRALNNAGQLNLYVITRSGSSVVVPLRFERGQTLDFDVVLS